MEPLPLSLQLSLRSGTVYKLQHRELTSALPHYLVVLNSTPQSSKLIVLGVFSSKVEETKMRRQREPDDTVVVISPEEYDTLSVESVVDCNSVKKISLEDIVQKYHNRQLKSCPDLNNEILTKIIDGVKKSRIVNNKLKALL
jgi:hypothetical protein